MMHRRRQHAVGHPNTALCSEVCSHQLSCTKTQMVCWWQTTRAVTTQCRQPFCRTVTPTVSRTHHIHSQLNEPGCTLLHQHLKSPTKHTTKKPRLNTHRTHTYTQYTILQPTYTRSASCTQGPQRVPGHATPQRAGQHTQPCDTRQAPSPHTARQYTFRHLIQSPQQTPHSPLARCQVLDRPVRHRQAKR